MFGGAAAGARATPEGRPDADHVFADAFEEVDIFHLVALSTKPLTPIPSFCARKLSAMRHGGRGRVQCVAPV